MKNINLEILRDTGIIAIIRAETSNELKEVVAALQKGGVRFIEVTMTTPNALKVIEEVSKDLKDVVIGVGSVLDAETARAAILSGAEFVVCPTLNKDVITLCNRYSKIVIPGAFTPTEILTAWEAGADLVKVFSSSIGGSSYIKAIKAPLPQISLVPVGGVNIDNVAEFIKAGASAVGVGGNLVKKEFLKEKNFASLTQLCKEFIDAIKEAKKK
ncbi:MAG: bifunctional 4-hydroxy-2-oxoglutarate aldolase/2-dehydro-3-deoxy-phosphogluconate aldolase [Candidatus Omnitrophica bacterium]|nr:bifunctional 4-hydroxy-2-oxoglutarate aldolase/2-dehydro-3-deoxy-phosphogluconate aldolase [Candidatus Omnitrophota bacterium]